MKSLVSHADPRPQSHERKSRSTGDQLIRRDDRTERKDGREAETEM